MKEALSSVGGSGGGKESYAQGACSETELNNALEKIKELNQDTNNLIKDHPPDIIFVYSKRSAESFIDLAKKYSLNGLMTGSRVMCISEKVINVFKEAGWKNLETFEAGDELIKATLRVANGRLTCAEALGHKEFVMTKLYRSA